MTDFIPEWWHWVVVGLGLIASELLIPSFVLVWFGLGALVVAGLMLLVDVTLWAQLLIWTVFSLAMVALWFRLFKRHYHKVLTGRASAEIIGEIGLVSQPVAPFQTGKIRLQKPVMGSDLWACVSDDTIEAGARAKIIKIEGTLLTVTRVES